MLPPLKPQSVMDLPEIVTFSPAQQQKLNEAIKKAMGRAASETRQELAAEKAKVTKLQAIISGSAILATLTSLETTIKKMRHDLEVVSKIAELEQTLNS